MGFLCGLYQAPSATPCPHAPSPLPSEHTKASRVESRWGAPSPRAGTSTQPPPRRVVPAESHPPKSGRDTQSHFAGSTEGTQSRGFLPSQVKWITSWSISAKPMQRKGHWRAFVSIKVSSQQKLPPTAPEAKKAPFNFSLRFIDTFDAPECLSTSFLLKTIFYSFFFNCTWQSIVY